ncbi:MAG: fumarylacetoacetate hydrolase family protein [Sphingobium sp.]
MSGLAHHDLARMVTDEGDRVVLVPAGADLTSSGEVALAEIAGRTFDDLSELLEAAGGDLSRIVPGRAWRWTSPGQFLSAVGRPRKVVCVGLNYRTHILEGGRPIPDHPELFPKFASSLTGPFADIAMPLATSRIDWEAEAVIVIGRHCRHVAARDAADAVLGYSIANDVSVRDYQGHASQWMAGKAWDASTPLGPVIVPKERCGGVDVDLAMTGRLNGEVIQSARTSDLVFGVAALVEYITSFMSLDAGDVVLTGTPGGVGAALKPPRFLQEGDIFEVEIDGMPILRNRFVQS